MKSRYLLVASRRLLYGLHEWHPVPFARTHTHELAHSTRLSSAPTSTEVLFCLERAWSAAFIVVPRMQMLKYLLVLVRHIKLYLMLSSGARLHNNRLEWSPGISDWMKFNSAQSLAISQKIKSFFPNLWRYGCASIGPMRQEPVFLDLFFTLFLLQTHSRRLAKGYVVLLTLAINWIRDSRRARQQQRSTASGSFTLHQTARVHGMFISSSSTIYCILR